MPTVPGELVQRDLGELALAAQERAERLLLARVGLLLVVVTVVGHCC